MIFTKDPLEPFNGIFSFFRLNSQDHDFFKAVKVEASSSVEGRGDPYVIVDPFVTGNKDADNWHSLNVQNTNLTFTFTNHFLSMSEYSIRSRNDYGSHFPLEWILEGTNDFVKWITIHYHPRNYDINGTNLFSSYTVANHDFMSTFRLTQIGTNDHSSPSYRYFFVLNKIEFFGNLVEKSSICYYSYFRNKNTFILYSYLIFPIVFLFFSS